MESLSTGFSFWKLSYIKCVHYLTGVVLQGVIDVILFINEPTLPVQYCLGTG